MTLQLQNSFLQHAHQSTESKELSTLINNKFSLANKIEESIKSQSIIEKIPFKLTAPPKDKSNPFDDLSGDSSYDSQEDGS